MAWRHEEVLQLIEMYRDGPELWDTEHPDYKHNYKRSAKLHLICKKLQRSQWDVKNKIKNLRTTFFRARKNYSNRKHGSSWAYYDQLSFIDVDKGNNQGSDDDPCENSERSDTEKIQSDEELDEFEEERCIWTQDECLTLIKLFKENECLWNSDNPLFNNHQSKLKAYKQMSEVLHKDTPDIKYKIKTLRTVLTRTHKKIQKAVDEHGCFAGKIWFAYEPLSFLLKGSNYTPIEVPNRIDRDNEMDFECDRNNGHLEGTDEYKNHLKYWDMDDTIKLMKMLEKHEELWNPSHKNYSIKVEKDKTLRHFAKTFNRHIIDVTSKIQNLRTQFHREVRKFHDAEINSKKKERVWFGYRYLSFLSRRETKNSSENVESETKNEPFIKSEEYLIKEETFQDEVIANDSDVSTDYECDKEEESYSNKRPKKSRKASSDFDLNKEGKSYSTKRSKKKRQASSDFDLDTEETSNTNKRPKKTRKTSSDIDLDRGKTSYTNKRSGKSRKRSAKFLGLDGQNSSNEDIKTSSRRSSEDFEREYFIDPLLDEFSTFGQFITQELRKISDECTLIKAKNDISNIIFEAQSQSIKKRNK